MKSNDPDASYDDISPIYQTGETPEERALIATLKTLVATGEVSDFDVLRVWNFVNRR